MTVLAILTQPSFVYIIVRMTVDASLGRRGKSFGGVTLSAAHNSVQTQYGKLTEVVVERQVASPGSLSVAGLASAFELAAMRIFAAMASHAVRGQFLSSSYCGMTGVAVECGVCP